MNLEKEESIRDLLKSLNVQERGWVICDHWQDDLCAIGIASSKDTRCLVYVSTFDKEVGKFDFECELPGDVDGVPYTVVRRGEDVDYDALLLVMEAHLG